MSTNMIAIAVSINTIATNLLSRAKDFARPPTTPKTPVPPDTEVSYTKT